MIAAQPPKGLGAFCENYLKVTFLSASMVMILPSSAMSVYSVWYLSFEEVPTVTLLELS